jgi:hypothetical protein
VYKRNNRLWLVHRTSLVDRDRERAWGHNERYSFIVDRRGTETWSAGFVGDVGKVAEDVKPWFIVIEAPWSFSDIPLKDLVKHPAFRMEGLATTDYGDVLDAVRIDFQLEGSDHDNSLEDSWAIQIATHGWIVLDPKHSWCVRGCGFRYRNSQTVARADLEYEFPKEHDPPYLKRQIIMVTAPGYKSVETTVFEELAPTTADRDEFTLSRWCRRRIIPGAEMFRSRSIRNRPSGFLSLSAFQIARPASCIR